MQIVSKGENLHKMSKPVSGKNTINLLSAECAQRVVKVKRNRTGNLTLKSHFIFKKYLYIWTQLDRNKSSYMWT